MGDIDAAFDAVCDHATEVLSPNWKPTWTFLQQCVHQLPHLAFADFESASIYGRVDHGRWSLQNSAAVPSGTAIAPLLAALGWKVNAATPLPVTVLDVAEVKRSTIGAWASLAH